MGREDINHVCECTKYTLDSSIMVDLTTLSSGQQIYIEKCDRTESDATEEDIPIIFIHGLLGSTVTYHPILSSIKSRSTILFDFQGHGNTPIHDPDTPLSPALFGKDIRDILDHYGYNKADIVAHSGGCIIGLQFAADYPDKIDRLVLLGPPAIPVPREQMLANAEMIRKAGLSPFIGVLKNWLGAKAQKDPEVEKILVDEMGRQDPQRAESVVRALAKYEFKEIRAVTTIVYGAEDLISTREMNEGLAKLTNAKVIELATGHQFTFEDADATSKVLHEILD